MTRIKHIRMLDELDAIKPVWTEFERLDDGPSVFQSWTWNRIWCDHVLKNLRRARLDVQVVEDGAGRTLAILPFFEESLIGPSARLIQFLGHRMSYHNDILLVNPKDPALADDVICALVGDLGHRAVLHLRHLDAGSIFTKQLIARHAAEQLCSRLWLRADPLITDQSKRLGPSRRKSFRLAENRMRRQYSIEFCIRSGTEVIGAFDELIDLHCRRFASARRSTLLVGPNLVFLREVTSVLSLTGDCEIIQLKVDEKTIAAALMIRDKGRYFFVQSGFDPEFSRFSPMRFLLTETIRRGFGDLGCEIYDFGAGYERYKFDWSPAVASNYFCCLGGSGLYAKSVGALYRAAFLSRLPTVQSLKEPRDHGATE